MHEWNWNNWGVPVMWLVWIPLIILVVWLIFRLMDGTRQKQLRGESPMDLLKRKYANGEITTEEFEQRKKVLEKE